MPPPSDSDNEFGALEEARKRLYAPEHMPEASRAPLLRPKRTLAHLWRDNRPPEITHFERRHVRLAGLFFAGALAFFAIALAVAGYLLYFGGNSVSVKNITLAVQGPATIAGGDTVPLTISITNRNPVQIDNATIEVDFPASTRSVEDVSKPMPIYSENLGSLRSGETVTRSIKAVVFGAAGDTVLLPITFSYDTQGSNSTFVKRSSHPLAISSTPLSISVDTVAETVAGKPFSLALMVRNNATVSIDNVVVAGTFPFGFTLTSSSISASGSTFPIGKLAAGESKTIMLTGTLDGQDGESRVLHFSIGTPRTAGSTELAMSYMTQDATILLTAPFIAATLTLNGSPLSSATLAPNEVETVTVSYTNTLSTNVADATIAVTLSGSAVDYASVRTNNGFYRSSDHTIVFSRDSDPTLATLAPGATGIGSFTFSTVSATQFGRSPSVTFSTSVRATRVGQSSVPEEISATTVQTIKAATAVALTASSLYSGGPFSNSGPVPPTSDTTTTYTIAWQAQNGGSAVADGTVSATLPSYVTYTGSTNGSGRVHYDSGSRTVTWSTGDLAQGVKGQAAFQVAFLPSTSQKGASPTLTSAATFAGYDRFAGVAVSALADPVTTETTSDPSYKIGDGTVQ